SAISKDSLKNSLLELECHFTWTLSKEDVDLDELEETIYDQIRFMIESNIQNYNLLSYVCHLKNSNEEALRSLQNAEEDVKKNHPDEIARRSLVTWGNYAWVYYHMERYKEAQIYVNKVKKSCKKLSSTAGGTICLPEISAEKGWALLKFGRKYYERAKESFKNALQIEPNNPEFRAGYAITMYRLEYHSHEEYEDEHTSINLLKRAVELNPKATFVMSLLALKLQDLGQADEGEKYMEEALQEAPCLPYVLRYAAKFYRRKGNVDKAVEVLEKALQITPSSSFLHHQLGLCYRAKLFSLGNTTGYTHQQEDNIIHQAIFHFKAALDRKTKFFCGHLDLADMYAKAKQYEKAEEMFQKALQINILSDNDQQEFCYRYGNFQLYHRKSESEAIRYYVKGLKIETKSSYWILKIINALKKLLERRIQRGLGDATDFGTLGFVHNLNGQKQEAVECYEQAIALCPDNEEYLSALCELRLSI
ncbi:IFIT5 protein, partial [Rhinopomastus cyanomelas]|nr:IFIT5 protein [Rhinopomastus cyanomelas]